MLQHRFRLATTIESLAKAAIPIRMYHGHDDDLAPIDNAHEFYQQLRKLRDEQSPEVRQLPLSFERYHDADHSAMLSKTEVFLPDFINFMHSCAHLRVDDDKHKQTHQIASNCWPALRRPQLSTENDDNCYYRFQAIQVSLDTRICIFQDRPRCSEIHMPIAHDLPTCVGVRAFGFVRLF